MCVCVGRVEYLVKWTGHPSSSNTWEPQKNLALDLIQAYESSKNPQRSMNPVRPSGSNGPGQPSLAEDRGHKAPNVGGTTDSDSDATDSGSEMVTKPANRAIKFEDRPLANSNDSQGAQERHLQNSSSRPLANSSKMRLALPDVPPPDSPSKCPRCQGHIS